VEILPGATHLLEEPGAIDQVAYLARDWLSYRHRQVKEVESVSGGNSLTSRPTSASGLPSGYRWEADHFSPRASLLRQELSSGNGRRTVAAGSEVIPHRAERPEKALRLLRRLEPPHGALTLACRLV